MQLSALLRGAFLFLEIGFNSFSAVGESVPASEQIAVYEGKGAVLAGDVITALQKSGYRVCGIKAPDLLPEGLRVFIVPGGYTAKIARGWGDQGREEIRRFVAGGGAYIGICAGAYLATDRVEVEGNPPGLGIIQVNNRRRSGLEVRTVHLLDTGDPLAQMCPPEVKIWYQNGPEMESGKGCTTVAVYRPGAAAVVRGRFGKGKVILFSPHPEGSREFNVDGEKLGSLLLLKNAIKWALED